MSLLFLGGDLFNAQEIGPVDKYQRSLLKKLGLNTEKNNSLSVHFSCNDLPNALAFGDRKIIVFKGIFSKFTLIFNYTLIFGNYIIFKNLH